MVAAAGEAPKVGCEEDNPKNRSEGDGMISAVAESDIGTTCPRTSLLAQDDVEACVVKQRNFIWKDAYGNQRDRMGRSVFWWFGHIGLFLVGSNGVHAVDVVFDLK